MRGPEHQHRVVLRDRDLSASLEDAGLEGIDVLQKHQNAANETDEVDPEAETVTEVTDADDPVLTPSSEVREASEPSFHATWNTDAPIFRTWLRDPWLRRLELFLAVFIRPFWPEDFRELLLKAPSQRKVYC